MKQSSESAGAAAPPPGPLGPGDWIGKKYQLKELRGAGGMGTVWVAHNAVLDIDVALKLMRFEQFQANPKRIFRRLLQEARAAARLEHPAIVRIFDFGLTDQGSPFIAMELLHGESLAELLAREPAMEATRAVQLLLPIADALSTAHGRGIIHRDIKPENLFLARDEYGRVQPKIVDFGVARFLEGGRTMTRSGALMGTPDYMAPEQARGDADLDTRVDIWALCVVLYELVAGYRPFGNEDANYLAVLRAIVHDEPNPQIREVAGDALWLILERGLRKKAHERWDTMRVLGEALALWLYEKGVREDALGASIKANWLQSGLGGVKIETASMSPPPAAVPAVKLAESGSLPVLAPVGTPESVARPLVNVSLAGVRPGFASRHSLALPSPKQSGSNPASAPNLSHAIDRLFAQDPMAPAELADATGQSGTSHVPFAESEPPTEPLHRRHGIDSSPLVEQTRALKRLVLASIAITALCALAVGFLLWDQKQTATVSRSSEPGATTTATPSASPQPTSVAAPSTPHADPAPSHGEPTKAIDNQTPGAAPEPVSEGAASASAASVEPRPSQVATSPSARPRRSAPTRKKKAKYELGF